MNVFEVPAGVQALGCKLLLVASFPLYNCSPMVSAEYNLA